MYQFIIGESVDNKNKRLKEKFPENFDIQQWLKDAYEESGVNIDDLPKDLSVNHDFYRLQNH